MDSCARLIGSVVPWRREARLRKRSSRFTLASLPAIPERKGEKKRSRVIATTAESRVVLSTCARQDEFIDVSRVEVLGDSKLRIH